MKRPVWFWNEREKRVRAGWRVLLQIVLTSSMAYGLYYWGVFDGGSFLLARIEVSLLIVSLLILWICMRILDKRYILDLGINLRDTAWWIDFAVGVGLGIIQAGVFLSIALFRGWIIINPVFQSLSGNFPLLVSVMIDLGSMLCVAIMEESIRAYQVRNIAEGVGRSTGKWRMGLLTGAIVASSFSVLMHLNQNGPGFWLYVFVRGLVYCIAFSFTGRVAIAVGLHLTWDFLITTIVSLGGADGINAAALFEAPLVDTLNVQKITEQMNWLGLWVQIIIISFLLLYIRIRTGKLDLMEKLTIYTPRKQGK